MKKLLFACLLFPTLSAQAMDGPEVLKAPLKARFLISGEDANTSSYILDKPLKFYRLEENEIPTKTYLIEWKEEIYPPQKGNSAQKENVPAYANCLSSQKEPILFYEEGTLKIRFNPRGGKASIHLKKDSTIDYILKHCAHSKDPERFRFAEETSKNIRYITTNKPQKVIGKDIKKYKDDIQNRGCSKLLEKNIHLVKWIESFFKEANPHQEYYSIHKQTFLSAVTLLRSLFGGKIFLKPSSQPEVYLQAKILKREFLLPIRREKEKRCIYEHRMISSFRNFLYRCGFYIEKGQLSLPKQASS